MACLTCFNFKVDSRGTALIHYSIRLYQLFQCHIIHPVLVGRKTLLNAVDPFRFIVGKEFTEYSVRVDLDPKLLVDIDRHSWVSYILRKMLLVFALLRC